MKKSWKRFLPLIICLAICLSLFTVSAFAEDAAQQPVIKQNDDGTWSAYDADGKVIRSGWVKQTRKDYQGKDVDLWYYASKGVLATEWQNIDNKWYYFGKSSEYHAPEMYYDTVAQIYDGKAPETYDEWANAKNYWYFNKDGSLYSGSNGWVSITREYVDEEGKTQTDKYWFYANSDGSLYKGWLEDGGSWYVVNPSMWHSYSGGTMMSPRDQWDGKEWNDVPHYFLNKDGTVPTNSWAVATGKDEEGNEHKTWFYATENGELATGWKQIDGKWYYFGAPDMPENNYNFMLQADDTWSGIFRDAASDKFYRVDKTGAMVTGWNAETWKDEEGNEHKTWFYATDSGAFVKDGWKQIDGKWYYFNGIGMAENQQVEYNDKTYYVGSDGAMVTGWNKLDDGSWNYYDDTGAQAQDEWKQVDGKWYYFNGATMAENQQVVDKDKTYYVGSDGAMATGWVQTDNGDWYNYGSDGAMQTGWVQDGDSWYYMDDNGVMLENTVTPDGYYVGSNGAWVPEN